MDRPWHYPAFFAVLCLGVGPSLAAAFGYLDGTPFVRSYLRHLRRSLPRWSIVVGGLGVVIADVVTLHDAMPGALLVPMLVVLAVLLVAAGVLAQAALSLRPDAGLRFVLAATVHRWWLSLLSLVMLAAAAVTVNQAPLLGLATVPGCALIVVWTNSRAALRQEG